MVMLGTRFAPPRPIGFMAGDVNLYRYVGNDPTDMVDPSGLSGKKSQKAEGDIRTVVVDLTNNHIKTSKYWIGIFSNAPAEDPSGNGLRISTGHVWVVLFDLEKGLIMARGLHPSKEITNQNPDCDGDLKDDSDEKFTVGRAFPINKEWCEYYVKQFKNLALKPPEYKVRSMNCTNFAIDFMKLSVPGLSEMPGATATFGASDIDDPVAIKNPSNCAKFLIENNGGNKASVLYDFRKK